MGKKVFNPIMPWEINEYEQAIFPCDAYKLSHRLMYPSNTVNLVCTLVARGSSKNTKIFPNFVWSLEFANKVVNSILDKFKKAVIEIGKEDGKGKVSQIIYNKLFKVFGIKEIANDYVSLLTDLGKYLLVNKKLPLIIKAKESNEDNEYQTPLLTIKGIDGIEKKYVWLINYFETIILENIWQHMTSLTIARNFKRLTEDYAHITADDNEFVKYQCHDFSMRGMSSFETAIYSASAHLQYFEGSDTILGSPDAVSVMASEHSVMSADGQELEFETYKRLIEKFPNGILSLVSDTYNIWNVLDNILPKLKKQILNRNGKLVIRPDSGNPIEIVCGKNYSPHDKKTWGVIHYLDHYFGHTHNKKNFKILNEKVGIIYGDAVTYEVASGILLNLRKQGWCSNCIVFGIGATTYQSNTRDTLGFVIKATAIQKEDANKNKEWFNIYKNPITDKKKKSITGTFDDEPNMVQIY